jgi:hypothetical protein
MWGNWLCLELGGKARCPGSLLDRTRWATSPFANQELRSLEWFSHSKMRITYLIRAFFAVKRVWITLPCKYPIASDGKESHPSNV